MMADENEMTEESKAAIKSVSWSDRQKYEKPEDAVTTGTESTTNLLLPLSENFETESIAIMCETQAAAMVPTESFTANMTTTTPPEDTKEAGGCSEHVESDKDTNIRLVDAAAQTDELGGDDDNSNIVQSMEEEGKVEEDEKNIHLDVEEVDVDEVSVTDLPPFMHTGSVTLCAEVAPNDVSVDDSLEFIVQQDENVTQVDTDAIVADVKATMEGATADPSVAIDNNNDNTEASTTSSCHRACSEDSASLLLSLPIDSLHCVASFLTPVEWANYGQSCTLAARICREIFRRVRMHAFRCATEVITAWKLEQQADARELAALYISSGVPIYPHSLGHSYHTLCWKMVIEAKELQEKAAAAAVAEASKQSAANNAEDNATDHNNQSTPIDRFYSDRFTTFRVRDGSSPIGSYLEEKCLYWLGPHSPVNNIGNTGRGRRGSTSMLGHHTPPRAHQPPPIPPPLVLAEAGSLGGGRYNHHPSSASSSPSRSLSQSDLTTSPSRAAYAKKMMIRVHRHLLDQHLLGRGSVDDGENSLTTPPVSLSVDFFHPHLTANSMDGAWLLSSPSPHRPLSPSAARTAMNTTPPRTGRDQRLTGPVLGDPALAAAPGENADVDPRAVTETAAADGQVHPVETAITDPARPPVENVYAVNDGLRQFEESSAPRGLWHHDAQMLPLPRRPESQMSAAAHDPWLSAMTPRSTYLSILNYVDLDVYSSGSANPKWKDGMSEMKRHIMARFDVYKGRLEVLLLHGDSAGFEECMLDFWDEFLPQTANIHYFDRHTAVPRMSNLQRFLTRPCPRAIGIVQCEIERIKISPSKRKGMSMKGRLFPTYEYRLFIRDREHGKQSQGDADNASEAEEDTGIRRDTVLMIAKNRGRKHVDTSGVVPMTPASKKGANNYYLYLPQQADVDAHFIKINEAEVATSNNPNGVSQYAVQPPTEEPCAPVLLGRLQSNFIGTEFQIFTPRARKQSPAGKPGHQRSASVGAVPYVYEDELDYDSGAASDSASSTSRRRSRFGRLTLRRSSSSGDQAVPLSDTPGSSSWMRSRPRQDGTGARAPRTNRRAIANEAVPADENESMSRTRKPLLMEEEDGVITYTANLLGSRPRIMDVCIPKVSPDGCGGYEWRRYLENNYDVDDSAPYNRMLNCFKQLQQQLENQELNSEDDDSNAVRDPTENYGLLALQNRPPWWNIELGSFVLNFRGRVSVASVKNFQLCDRNDHDHIMLQFGRIQGRHSFTMDFQYPLTAVQAFSIAISSLQSKISFG